MAVGGREAAIAGIQEIVPALAGMPEWSELISLGGDGWQEESALKARLGFVTCVIDTVASDPSAMHPVYSNSLATRFRRGIPQSRDGVDTELADVARDLARLGRLVRHAGSEDFFFTMPSRLNLIRATLMDDNPLTVRHPVWRDRGQVTFDGSDASIKGRSVTLVDRSNERGARFPDLDPHGDGSISGGYVPVANHTAPHLITIADISEARDIERHNLAVWGTQVGEAVRLGHVSEQQLFLMKMGAALLNNSVDIELMFGDATDLDREVQQQLLDTYLECIHGSVMFNEREGEPRNTGASRARVTERELSLADWNNKLAVAALRATGIRATRDQTSPEVLVRMLHERVRFGSEHYATSPRMLGKKAALVTESGADAIKRFASDLYHAAGVPASRLRAQD